MRTIYRLMLEQWTRDLAVSTAAGVTAGMRAALGDAELALDARVQSEIGNVFAELEGVGPRVIATGDSAPQLPPKRGRGRPPKIREGGEGASHV